MVSAPTTRRRAIRAQAVAGPRRALRRIPPTAGLVAAGWAALLLAWLVSNPPFLAPDEPAHYLRAIAVGEGKLDATPTVEVPADLWARWRDPGGPTCNAGDQERSAACVTDAVPADDPVRITTAAGAYPPLYYLAPGVALRAGRNPFDAVRLARAAGAVVSFAFLALALALLVARENERLSLTGLLLAVSPMVLFVLASLNSSSLEIAAGIAFFAALLRLSRDAAAAKGWVWAAAAVAGVALGLSRATGVLWIVLDVVLFVGLAGPRRALAVFRAARGAAVATAALLVIAAVTNRVWEQLNGNAITQQGSTAAAEGGSGSSVRSLYWHGFQQLRRVFDEEVGVFGWLDSVMPYPAYPAWEALVAGIVILAFVAATRRERVVLVGAVALSAAVVVWLSATLVAATGADVQGRHVLPFAVVVPMLAGELLFRNRARLALLDLGALFGLVALGVAGLQLVGWLTNSFRQSVGIEGPRFFLTHAAWSPPLGWLSWLFVALVGAALLAAPALLRPLRPR